MKKIEDIVYDLVIPMVENTKDLSVKELPSLNEQEILITIYAKGDDVGRLIGRQGVVINSLRNTMAIGSRVLDRKITIEIESY